mmetsp:Transcript_9252/g.19982  ORF Transcript_9252/g.19982 Transcript_9252/m.19982 type:complete len:93 (-) Transcript_9252:449-727(-)
MKRQKSLQEKDNNKSFVSTVTSQIHMKLCLSVSKSSYNHLTPSEPSLHGIRTTQTLLLLHLRQFPTGILYPPTRLTPRITTPSILTQCLIIG